MMTAVEDALALTKRGFHVFPLDHPDLPKCIGIRTDDHDPDTCTQRGKHPYVPFTKQASTDPKTIAMWFTAHVRNVGIYCGSSGLLVVDEDVPDVFIRHASSIGEGVPETFTVATGKGRHYYFLAPDGVKLGNTTGDLPDGIDVRAGRAYAVGPTSQHANGSTYEIENDVPIAPAPSWLIDTLTRRRTAESDWETFGYTPALDRLPAVIKGPIAGKQKGERHETLVRYASSLRARNVPIGEAEILMKEAAWRRCQQPSDCDTALTLDEALGKLHDIYGRYDVADRYKTVPTEDEGVGHNGHDVSDLKITTLADVEAERVEWLWKGRLPRGKLVVFDGDPELGKSTLALTFAAAITTEYETGDGVMGGLWPDGDRCEYSGDVIILSAEDGLADTVRPRLDAAGGDPAKVHSVDAAIVVGENGELIERAITLADVDRLHRAIRYYAAKLVIVDVLMAYLPGDRDSHRDQDVRSIFAPLSRIAADTGCTILVLRHLNKGKGGNPLYRGGGSIAIVGAARVGLLVAKCPTDDDETVCAFAVQKSNLSAKPETLTYRIVECINGAGKVQWVGSTDKPIHELLADVERDLDVEVFDERDYTGDFKESWLYKYLKDALDAKAQVRPKDAVTVGADKGISRASVFRLFDKLANAGMARSIDGTEFPRVTHWELIDAETTGPDTQTRETTETTGPDLHKQGETTADLFNQAETTAETTPDQAKQSAAAPVVSVVSPDPGEPPPGGVTTNTPGMTDRVVAALAKAAQLTDACIDCHTRPHSAGRPRCDECHRAYLITIDGYDR